MRYLLDTHTLIWLDGSSSKLSPKARSVIADPDNIMLLSLVSVWEIQIKHQLGKLQLRQPLAQLIEHQRQVNQIELLPITLPHILGLAVLPDHHKDPFDRLLISQATAEGVTLISHDPHIAQYAVQVVW